MARVGPARKTAKPKADREADVFRALVDGLPDAMMVIADRRVVYANRAMEDLLSGTEGTHLVGSRFTDLLAARSVPALATIEAIATGGAKSNRVEIIWRRSHQGPAITECGVGPTIWEGRPATQVVARDVTDQRRAERAQRTASASMTIELHQGKADLMESNRRLGAETVLREQAELDLETVLGRLALAGEEERKRLSRELHDEVGQHLTQLLLGLQRIIDVAAVGSEVDERARALHELAQRLGSDLHGVAVRLRPKALDDFGIDAALLSYMKELTRQSGIAAELQTTGHKARLAETLETAMYRIAQEALTNVARHSGATRVSVVLHKGEDTCRLAIEDDGAGFDPEAARSSARAPGLGLLGIRERARLVGGSVEIESTPGRGTSVFVTIPTILADRKAKRRARG